jgi:hypothetical protein
MVGVAAVVRDREASGLCDAVGQGDAEQTAESPYGRAYDPVVIFAILSAAKMIRFARGMESEKMHASTSPSTSTSGT